MKEHLVIEATHELMQADESHAMAERHGDLTARRSSMERRAVAFAKLKEAVAAVTAPPRQRRNARRRVANPTLTSASPRRGKNHHALHH